MVMTRKFKIFEFDNINHYEYIVSEDDIKRDYYPYWYEKMCLKYGKKHVDDIYTFEHCLDDWCVVHWAIKL
jgi:hypothetical protein